MHTHAVGLDLYTFSATRNLSRSNQMRKEEINDDCDEGEFREKSSLRTFARRAHQIRILTDSVSNWILCWL